MQRGASEGWPHDSCAARACVVMGWSKEALPWVGIKKHCRSLRDAWHHSESSQPCPSFRSPQPLSCCALVCGRSAALRCCTPLLPAPASFTPQWARESAGTTTSCLRRPPLGSQVPETPTLKASSRECIQGQALTARCAVMVSLLKTPQPRAAAVRRWSKLSEPCAPASRST